VCTQIAGEINKQTNKQQSLTTNITDFSNVVRVDGVIGDVSALGANLHMPFGACMGPFVACVSSKNRPHHA
jgi:hypothetical protein